MNALSSFDPRRERARAAALWQTRLTSDPPVGAPGRLVFSVALIGPDGAGKTTLTRLLHETLSLPLKPCYMGINIGASNHALFTSRIMEYFRRLRRTKAGIPPTEAPSARQGSGLAATIWALGRLVNRLADEWFRQFVSWFYQARGYIVLYDRHFLFDFALEEVDASERSVDSRLHRWLLVHFYPRPDLVIYLDAPAEVLYARKREKSIQELDRRRRAFIRQGSWMPHFVQIDATQPLLKVYSDVVNCIYAALLANGKHHWPKHPKAA